MAEQQSNVIAQRGIWMVCDGGEGFTHVWYQDSERTAGWAPVERDFEPDDVSDLARVACQAAGLVAVDAAELRAALEDAFRAGEHSARLPIPDTAERWTAERLQRLVGGQEGHDG